ncbi:UPF0496 protein At3g49070 [Prunus avium]|uniref:UPF0496 protein At3g49070 n=1 Tax=Prunus avium TaxID=42229 RepID=A0A6P5TIH7_PRUAV|nr:UPF0496 protein At3g49070 [Prunus avium]XP_021827000.1 UPF0496 protein At3g49070 [Prunus avium]
MGKRISARIRKFISCTGAEPGPTRPPTSMSVDVTEEYANAFRTESYLDFWTRVVALSNGDSTKTNKRMPMESTTAARLPSYRLFAEHLLDPDQPMVARILTMAPNHPTLLSDYFTQTADASILCGLLLKDIDRTRVKYRSIKTSLQSLNDRSTPETLTRLTKLTTALSLIRIQAIQAGCSNLLKRLESTRNKARAKLRLANKLRAGSAIFLVALTASLSVIVVTHALALVVAMPAFIAASLDLASQRRLARMAAQLDAATKGTYILNRDLETVSRLVARLNDEIEHMHGMVKFWVGRGEDWSQASGEVARQLKKNDCSFRQQLDELEEHLYLCFMTINRARNLVVKEILDPGQITL